VRGPRAVKGSRWRVDGVEWTRCTGRRAAREQNGDESKRTEGSERAEHCKGATKGCERGRGRRIVGLRETAKGRWAMNGRRTCPLPVACGSGDKTWNALMVREEHRENSTGTQSVVFASGKAAFACSSRCRVSRLRLYSRPLCANFAVTSMRLLCRGEWCTISCLHFDQFNDCAQAVFTNVSHTQHNSSCVDHSSCMTGALTIPILEGIVNLPPFSFSPAKPLKGWVKASSGVCHKARK
jgi:hypothetical protein